MIKHILFAVAVFFVAAKQADAASVRFDLISSLLYAQPGQTVAFSAAVSNTGTTPAYINGDSFTSMLPVDDLFLLLAPPVLAPGASLTIPVFDVAVPAGTAPGLYTGTFDVLGGDTAAAFDVLATAPFAVQVVPEPSTMLLTLAGLAMAAARLRQRRARRN